MKTEIGKVKDSKDQLHDVEITIYETREEMEDGYRNEAGEVDWDQIVGVVNSYERQRAKQNAYARLNPKLTIAARRANLWVTYKDELFALAQEGKGSEIEAFLQAKLDAGEGN